MLIQFTLKNNKCFKEEIKFSLIASNYDKNTRTNNNTFTIEKFNLRLLKSAVIYGANASGKTKLVEGVKAMKQIILNSSKEGQIDEPIGVTPFLLNTETESAPTTFEIIFIHENELYRYGFEADSNIIHAEWLYHRPKTKETELFYREYQNFDLNKRKFKVNDLIERDRVRPNALLLSVAANWNEKIAVQVFDWLKRFNIFFGLEDVKYSAMKIDNEANRTDLVNFISRADLGIEKIDIKSNVKAYQVQDKVYATGNVGLVRESDLEDWADDESYGIRNIKTYHKKYDENNLPVGEVEFSMKNDESAGVRKYFALSAPILEILRKGEILFVDELTDKLHPNLAHQLLAIFNSAAHNPNNAQLIFTTHNTNFLSSGLFRRDQIWFVEKDRYGAASLYSLGDFKTDKVRKEDNFEKNYLKGKYGAVPYLGDFKESLTKISRR